MSQIRTEKQGEGRAWIEMQRQWLADMREIERRPHRRRDSAASLALAGEASSGRASSPAASADAEERRVSERIPTALLGRLRTRSLRQDIRVLDISLSGARLKLTESLRNSRKVAIAIERMGGASGRVVWRNGLEVGVAFDPLPRDAAALLRSILPRRKRAAAAA